MTNKIVNNKAEDKYKDEHKPSEEFKKSHQHNCKNCADTTCCNKGKDKMVYCCCYKDAIKYIIPANMKEYIKSFGTSEFEKRLSIALKED